MRKIFLSFLVSILALFAISFIKVEATTFIQDAEIKVIGAQVRTTGEKQGIRFVGNVGAYDLEDASKVGIAIAFGKVEATDSFCKEGTINGKSVLFAEIEKANIDENGNFYVVLYGVPEASYVQNVTARAYVVGPSEVIYGTTVTVRSLAEVCLKVKNDGVSATLIDTVITSLSSYKKMYNKNNECYINGALYEYNYTKLGAEFLKDYNEFVNADDRVTSICDDTNKYSGGKADFYYSAKANKGVDIGSGNEAGCTDISDSNIYRFFNDATMKAKWDWLLTFIKDAGNTNSQRQIDAIQGDGTNSAGLYNGQHFLISLMGFFTKQKIEYYYTGIDWTTAKASLYDTLPTQNNKVYADLQGEQLVKVGESVVLPAALDSATGYEWDGWYVGSTKYAANSSYLIAEGTNIKFSPKFKVIVYTITFYDGANVLSSLTPTNYNINTETITLPNYDKAGFAFDGWYDNSGLAGNVVTEITKGSIGNKAFFAKTTETNNKDVSIMFNLNGGNWKYSSRDAMVADFLEDAKTKYNKTNTATCMINDNDGNVSGFVNIFSAIYGIFNDDAYGQKWTWLKEYIISKSTGGTLTSLNSGNESFWRYSLGAFLFKDYRSSWPASADFTTEAMYNGFWDCDYLAQSSFTYREAQVLPTPYKDGYTFDGWYLEPEFTTKVTNFVPTTEEGTSRTYYAKWGND